MKKIGLTVLAAVGLSGCATVAPLPTEPQVDIPRFMGTWHVIAHIPAFLERHAHAATETYELQPPNVVKTTFRFRDGSLTGAEKVYRPTGYVDQSSGGGLWGMQFVWPIRAEFRIMHVSADYQYTIIGRSKRDYVWIMARAPEVPESAYRALVQRVSDAGYDISRLRRVPQPGVDAAE